MMINITPNFRTINSDDIFLINQLIYAGKSYWGYPKDGMDRFMQIYSIPDKNYLKKNFGFIALSDAEVIGMYIFCLEETPPYLAHFLLNTRFIGQGYGRILWNHCVAQARQKGWTAFNFVSDPNALGFYLHMGAVVTGEFPMTTIPGQMAPVMRFDLEL